MTATLDVAALPEWLASATQPNGGEIAVLAGHFAIFSGGSAAVDLLDGAADAPPGAAEMLDFTRLTWRIACDVATAHPDHPFRIVTLVDDIQFVRPVMRDRAMVERLASALARDYLEAVPELPAWHARELAARSLTGERLLRHSDVRSLFSERELRHSAVRHLRECLADGTGADGLTSTDNGNTMTVTVPEQGDYCLVHSGHTSCAGGYVELLATLHQRGIGTLIAFVPMRCLGQVVLGTELAGRLFGLKGFNVINVGIADTGTAVVSR